MYGFSQGSLCLLLYFMICVVVVSCYLLHCGARTVKENRKQ